MCFYLVKSRFVSFEKPVQQRCLISVAKKSNELQFFTIPKMIESFKHMFVNTTIVVNLYRHARQTNNFLHTIQ